LPARLTSVITSRIKVMARLDIAERRLPQDGRIGLSLGGKLLDVRVSTLPARAGERVVLRLLDKDQTSLALEDLGMSEPVLAAFRAPCANRTASFWSPARPALARPRRSTPRSRLSTRP